MLVRTPSPFCRAFLGALVVTVCSARANWREEVGYTRLLETFPSGVPAGLTAGVSLVEAGDSAGNHYLPNAGAAWFAGKTITNRSSGSGVSGHATDVATYFFGIGTSLVPGTTVIDAYNASHWTSLIPYTESRRVQNHSWVARSENYPVGTDLDAASRGINARVDHMVNGQGLVVVAGADNGAGSSHPVLLVQGYNLISVGVRSGQHSTGLTAYDGAGRTKPDLVAPGPLTSYSTPQVASAAALLAEKLTESAFSTGSGVNQARVVKALLLAGATKEEFPSWARTDTRPLDATFGAGLLNVFLSYRTLLGGPVSASSSQLRPNTAWAHSSVSSSTNTNSRTYLFEIPAGSVATRFSAALVWQRPTSTFVQSVLTGSLANLSLTLHQVSGTTVGAVVDGGLSDSPVDNVEHIYLPALPPGRYALRVGSTTSTNTFYALAWRSSPTVTLAATVASASESDPAAPAVFTLTRTGSTTSPLLVPLNWSGSAVSGVHYTAPTSVLIPAGSASVSVSVFPVADSLAQGNRSVTLTVATDFSLSAGTPASATATILDKPYDAWRHGRFSAAQLADPAVSGEAADPDGDGLANLLEYAFAGEPFVAGSVPAERRPTPGLAADGRLTLSYFHAAERPDISYVVEWTDDLASGVWQTGSGVVAEVSRVEIEGGEWVTVRAEAAPGEAAPRQFLRLRVTRQ